MLIHSALQSTSRPRTNKKVFEAAACSELLTAAATRSTCRGGHRTPKAKCFLVHRNLTSNLAKWAPKKLMALPPKWSWAISTSRLTNSFYLVFQANRTVTSWSRTQTWSTEYKTAWWRSRCTRTTSVQGLTLPSTPSDQQAEIEGL